MVKQKEAGDHLAQEKLIEHNMRLVAHIAKKYASSGFENDDLIAIGSIGLIKAVQSYDSAKSTHLATYASRCIENEILMVLRASKKQKAEISLSEAVGTDKEGNEITLLDILDNGEKDVGERVMQKAEVRDLVRRMNRVLDRREKKILLYRFGLNGQKPLTQREVAQKLGISRSYVSRIEKASLEKLKKST